MIYLEEEKKPVKGKKFVKNKTLAPKLPKKKLPVEQKYLSLKEIDQATKASIFYGFTPIELPTLGKEDILAAKEFKKTENLDKDCGCTSLCFSSSIEERIRMFRYFEEKTQISGGTSLMVVYNGSIGEAKVRKGLDKKVTLEVLGSNKGISVALAIKASLAILSDYGYKDLSLEINSLGDKESVNRFNRELTNYYRKNIGHLSAHCRQAFKKDAFAVLTCDNKTCQSPLKDESPKAITYLSDESRESFKEVLEFLEKMEISYKINNWLIPDRHLASQTVFSISGVTGKSDKRDTLACGFCYDTFAKKVGFKKELPGLVVKLSFSNVARIKDTVVRIRKPHLYFIQLSSEAKHKALALIELLREHNILVYQAIGRDKLGSQLAIAERMKIPFLLIMGKKEALENTVMIRNLRSRQQFTIPIADLPEYIKKNISNLLN